MIIANVVSKKNLLQTTYTSSNKKQGFTWASTKEGREWIVLCLLHLQKVDFVQ